MCISKEGQMTKINEYNSGKMATREQAEEYIKTHSPTDPIPEEIMNLIRAIMDKKTKEMTTLSDEFTAAKEECLRRGINLDQRKIK
jgi:hypothetical protein